MEEKTQETKNEKEEFDTHIYSVRTTANREKQVMDFLDSKIKEGNTGVYATIKAHGMRGYIFAEAEDKQSIENMVDGIPYAKGVLDDEVEYGEIDHMLEQVKTEHNIQEDDVVEVISGPFKREKAKVKRVDETKDEVVVELLQAAVPIPITVNLDDVKVIRREDEEEEENE